MDFDLCLQDVAQTELADVRARSVKPCVLTGFPIARQSLGGGIAMIPFSLMNTSFVPITAAATLATARNRKLRLRWDGSGLGKVRPYF